MLVRTLVVIAATAATCAPEALAQDRINPMIALHERGGAVLGLYAPANRSGRGSAADAVQRTPHELAAETLGFERSDFVFTGSMEGGVDRGIGAWTAYVDALQEQGATARSHPLVLKAPKIGTDADATRRDIGRQLDTGASVIMFVEVESADEVRIGLEAMRFEADGGVRHSDPGQAARYWGVTDDEYRARADLWPLATDGELINWTIVESLEGLAKVREIAAVPGVGVLWPGAGTLRRVFTRTGPDGERVFDEAAWEAAIQKVLDACIEFDVPCGFPANENDIERRMAQGFEVFVMGWGEAGFRTVDVGRAAAGR